MGEPETESSERVRWSLDLPEPLTDGEGHEFAVRVLAADSPLHHYVCVPQIPCAAFDLRVRFGPEMPEKVVALQRAFQLGAEDELTSGSAVVPDLAGEVRVRFRDLVPGFAYGLR
ncbi:hypothetical protein V5P93_001963 [Actinokineospora auranticolor]|uniref:hypothetical protein n=1 Tax=Actinokineospora auranticolor TaxID=155976 RepID=UPI0011B05B60|nr:hypothetical protein [Actinokineospora auranticolor]